MAAFVFDNIVDGEVFERGEVSEELRMGGFADTRSASDDDVGEFSRGHCVVCADEFGEKIQWAVSGRGT